VRGLSLARLGVVGVDARDGAYPRSTSDAGVMIWMLDAPVTVTHPGGTFVLDVGDVMMMPDRADVEFTYAAGISHQGYVVFESDSVPDRVLHRSLAPGDIIPIVLSHLLRLDAERPEGWREVASRAFEYACSAFYTGQSSVERHGAYTTSDAVPRAIRHARRVWGDLSYLRSLTLTELAEAALVSPPYLCRVFARDIGVGPVECFRLLQLKRAANYLNQTTLAVAEIAARAGYSDESAFSRAFRKASGFSPRQFRHDRALEFELPARVRRLAYSTLLT
jgi:AraC-like DNA-binding protein